MSRYTHASGTICKRYNNRPKGNKLECLILVGQRWELPGNYPHFQKIWSFIPLFGELCIILVTPDFYKNIYTYTLIYIIYLGEPSGNTISNPHGTFIHIFMHGYNPNFKKYILNVFFPVNVAVLFADVSTFLQCYF